LANNFPSLQKNNCSEEFSGGIHPSEEFSGEELSGEEFS
jgi:hypothetical protein